MFRNDYLMGMIEDMASVISKVFGLKQQKKLTEALWELDDMVRQKFQLNNGLINRLPAEEVIELFRIGSVVEVDRLQALARLMREEADIYELSEKEQEAVVRRIKSLHLFLYCAVNDADRTMFDYPEQIDQLTDELADYALPAAVEHLFVQYEEQEGYYDNAVDALKRLTQLDPVQGHTEGQALYKRLLLLSDEQLEEGGISRAELNTASAELETQSN